MHKTKQTKDTKCVTTYWPAIKSNSFYKEIFKTVEEIEFQVLDVFSYSEDRTPKFFL